MSSRDLIVLGASAGGVHALQTVVSALPAGLPAAVLAVQHIGAHPSMLPALLNQAGPLPATHASHGERYRTGHIYVAPPDRHLMVDDDRLTLSDGPKENFARPSIDALFRSAAVAAGPRVIGAILTGRLEDGVVGLAAVKVCGGLALVQDPREAMAPSMPENALRSVDVDFVLPLGELGAMLGRLAGTPAGTAPIRIPDHIMLENTMTASGDRPLEDMDRIGRISAFTCPECHGTLWQLSDRQPLRYRCHTGHAFSAASLAQGLSRHVEDTMWSAIRALHEKQALFRKLALHYGGGGDAAAAASYERAAREAGDAAAQIQGILRGRDHEAASE
ncbi:chemotaxis protein CheB [Pigmentiphaga soli]|uniref:protein-glutamate methylesterase n=1 Tax=Pigmentiphaga soli TaxID=1007095 RepID=A0ABP8HIJ5_9BURK